MLNPPLLTAPPRYVGPGDIKPGAFAWWGLRAYSRDAIGRNCVDIVRASDSTTRTFTTLNNGGVDAVAMAVFLAGTTGKVSKLYDQTGNGWDLIQATSANRPDIRLNAAQLGGLLPTMDFRTANSQSMVSAATGLSTATGTFSAVSRAYYTYSSFSGILQCSDAGIGHANNAGYSVYQGSFVTTNVGLDETFNSLQVVCNGASSLISVNGIQKSFTSGATAFGSPFTLGKVHSGAFMRGSISEVGFWNSVWSATEAAAVDANQKSYYFSKPQYEGVVASRCRYLAGALDTTNKFVMARSAHIASEALSAVKIIHQNRFTTTITQGIEYNGNFWPVTWDSVSSVTGGLTFVSDYIPVSIPAGATFWVRTYWQGVSGSIYNPWQNTFLGEATTLSATALTDQTLGGTITNSGAFSMPPMAIVGVTVNPSVVIIGDSISVGFGDTEDTSNTATGRNGVVGYYARGCLAVPFANVGISGATASGFGNETRPLLAVGSHVFCDYGVNDFYSGSATSTALIASLTNNIFNYTRSNQKCYQSTITPKTTSTDSWATTVNQTLVLSAQNTQRIAFNTALRGGSTGIPHLTGYVDAASVVESSLNSGLWIVNGSSNYATSDGLHPGITGVSLIDGAPAVPVANWIAP